MSAKRPGRPAEVIEAHISRNLASMASGAYTSRLYSRFLLTMLSTFTLRKGAAERYAIR